MFTIIAVPCLDTFSSSYSNPVAFALAADLRPGSDDTTFILDRAISSEERAFLDASQCVVHRMSLEESKALMNAEVAAQVAAAPPMERDNHGNPLAGIPIEESDAYTARLRDQGILPASGSLPASGRVSW
jgi:hypothetical protein